MSFYESLRSLEKGGRVIKILFSFSIILEFVFQPSEVYTYIK